MPFDPTNAVLDEPDARASGFDPTQAVLEEELPHLEYPAEMPAYVSELKGAMLANELPKATPEELRTDAVRNAQGRLSPG